MTARLQHATYRRHGLSVDDRKGRLLRRPDRLPRRRNSHTHMLIASAVEGNLSGRLSTHDAIVVTHSQYPCSHRASRITGQMTAMTRGANQYDPSQLPILTMANPSSRAKSANLVRSNELPIVRHFRKRVQSSNTATVNIEALQ
jgi:hypothetical protein